MSYGSYALNGTFLSLSSKRSSSLGGPLSVMMGSKITKRVKTISRIHTT